MVGVQHELGRSVESATEGEAVGHARLLLALRQDGEALEAGEADPDHGALAHLLDELPVAHAVGDDDLARERALPVVGKLPPAELLLVREAAGVHELLDGGSEVDHLHPRHDAEVVGAEGEVRDTVLLVLGPLDPVHDGLVVRLDFVGRRELHALERPELLEPSEALHDDHGVVRGGREAAELGVRRGDVVLEAVGRAAERRVHHQADLLDPLRHEASGQDVGQAVEADVAENDVEKGLEATERDRAVLRVHERVLA